MSGYIGDKMISRLGGGIPGAQPKGGLLGGGAGSNGGTGMTGSSERGRDRVIIRQAFGNRRLPTATNNFPNSALTPFRRMMTAGDLNGTKNKAGDLRYGASNQVNNVRSSSNAGWGVLAGSVKNGPAAFTGNPTYVYDSSDYIRFKKLQSKKLNYNDSSFGGDQNYASQTALSAVRR
jgi:hypothetical protein